MSSSPDFSAVDTFEKANALYEKGELEPLFLQPLEFGGEAVAENTVFVPLGFAEVKSNFDLETVAPLVEEGRVTQYAATPRYQGDSFVPCAIEIRAWDPEEVTAEIAVWGAAVEAVDE